MDVDVVHRSSDANAVARIGGAVHVVDENPEHAGADEDTRRTRDLGVGRASAANVDAEAATRAESHDDAAMLVVIDESIVDEDAIDTEGYRRLQVEGDVGSLDIDTLKGDKGSLLDVHHGLTGGVAHHMPDVHVVDTAGRQRAVGACQYQASRAREANLQLVEPRAELTIDDHGVVAPGDRDILEPVPEVAAEIRRDVNAGLRARRCAGEEPHAVELD